MNVFIACEFSGAIRDAFRDLGHEAWSCDLENVKPEGKYPNYHLFGDCRLWLNGFNSNTKWDLMIAHPPYTYLAVCNAQDFKYRQVEQKRALEFVQQLMDASIHKICIENPISVISTRIRKPDQIIQPWMFGHGETKATCLWLKNLSKLKPTNIVSGREAKIHRMAPGPNRSKNRSRTYVGIAKAIADQWGT